MFRREPPRFCYPCWEVFCVEEELSVRRAGDVRFFDEDVGRLYQRGRCPFCDWRLKQTELQCREHSDYFSKSYLRHLSSTHKLLFQCDVCGWWALHEWGLGHSGHTPETDDVVHWGKIAGFDVPPAKPAMQALRARLCCAQVPLIPTPKALQDATQEQFSTLSPCAATHLGGPSGTDHLILIEGGSRFLVHIATTEETKRVAEVSIVTNLLGVELNAGAPQGLVVQMVEPFACTERGARSAARSGQRRVVQIENCEAIQQLLGTSRANPSRPWVEVLNPKGRCGSPSAGSTLVH